MAIPDFLLNLPRWVLWRQVASKTGRPTKVPFSMRGGKADATNPATWSEYHLCRDALARAKAWDGVGVVLGDLGNGEILAGLDLDSCLDADGALADWARGFLGLLNTYCEISPSGRGLKIFVRFPAKDLAAVRQLFGIADNAAGRKKTFGEGNGHPPAAELYLSGRYFAVTGNQWTGSVDEVAICSTVALGMVAQLFGPPAVNPARDDTIEDTTAPDMEALRTKLRDALATRPFMRERWHGSTEGLVDTSGSGMDMSLGSMLKGAGFTYPEMREVLIAFKHGSGAEHASAGDERYFQRIWARAASPPPPEPPEPELGYWDGLDEGPQGEPDPEPDARPRQDWTGHDLPILWARDIEPVLDVQDFVQGVLIETGAVMVYGKSNSGKTFWVGDLSLHIAAGKMWNGRRVEQSGVVYCVLEGGNGFMNRVAAWKARHGVTDLPFAAIPASLDLRSPDADVHRLIAAVKAVAALLSIPLRLIVVDTLARAMAGGNENSPEDMGALVRNMDLIRAETGAAVLFVHHCGKDELKGARGHSSLQAAIDTEIEVVANDETKTHSATVSKQRELRKGDVFGFRLGVVELGTNRHGEAVTTCVVGPLEAGEQAPARGNKRGPRNKNPDMAARALENAISRYGAPLPYTDEYPRGVVGVPVGRWRDEFRQLNGADDPSPEDRKSVV